MAYTEKWRKHVMTMDSLGKGSTNVGMDALGINASEVGPKHGMIRAWMLSQRDALEDGDN